MVKNKHSAKFSKFNQDYSTTVEVCLKLEKDWKCTYEVFFVMIGHNVDWIFFQKEFYYTRGSELL